MTQQQTDVEILLTEKGIPFHNKGKDTLIKCLNPEHDDDNPSLRIDNEHGHFHCLSCGYKGNIFKYFNRYRNIFNAKVAKTKKLVREIRMASWSGFDIPTDAFFWSRLFRGIPAAILTKFEAFQTSQLGMADRIVFPIRDSSEKIVAFQGRYVESMATPKYLMYPAEVAMPWYPNISRLDLLGNSIILVEGLLDALYLHGQGITNAVCTFGTKSVSMDNIESHLMPFLVSGIDTVYLLMDGDAAGRSATKHLENCIKQKTDLLVVCLELPDGIDPATMDSETVEELKNMLQKR